MNEKPNGCSVWVRAHELGDPDEEQIYYSYRCDLPARLHPLCYFYEPDDAQRGRYSCRFNRTELDGQPCSCCASGAREEAIVDALGPNHSETPKSSEPPAGTVTTVNLASLPSMRDGSSPYTTRPYPIYCRGCQNLTATGDCPKHHTRTFSAAHSCPDYTAKGKTP